MEVLIKLQDLLDKTRKADFLAPLLLRLYLVPVFWMGGTSKLEGFSDTVAWFGNSEWGLGMPMPEVMAFLATSTELAGAVLLLIGFGVRWISIPLMFTMIVAAVTVHMPNGWAAIAESPEAAERLEAANNLLQAHGNYEWLTEKGSFVILNNGIEFAATYFIMLLTLFFIGGGRYFSIDYWVRQKFMK